MPKYTVSYIWGDVLTVEVNADSSDSAVMAVAHTEASLAPREGEEYEPRLLDITDVQSILEEEDANA